MSWVMAAGYFNMSNIKTANIQITPQQGVLLLNLARKSIGEYLRTRHQLQPSHEGIDAPLLEWKACFVTLLLHGELRGCIGSLEPRESLLDNVAHNAVSAAFSDPRFSPVTADEFPLLHIDISVLGTPAVMNIQDEASLVRQLRPGVDGLILHAPNGARATFLPSVWEQLPDPQDFVMHLKRKAGLPANYWHEGMRAERYEVQYLEELSH